MAQYLNMGSKSAVSLPFLHSNVLRRTSLYSVLSASSDTSPLGYLSALNGRRFTNVFRTKIWTRSMTENRTSLDNNSEKSADSKLTHKQWRAKLRREKRRVRRQEQAKGNEDVEIEDVVKDEEFEKLKEQRDDAERIYLNAQFLEREKQAEDEWERKKKQEVLEKEKREEQEKQIKEEWEERQKKEMEEQEKNDKKDKERKSHQENLLRQATANENKDGNSQPWHNPIVRIVQGKERERCPFFSKTGACRFGERCSRAHPHPDTSTTLLFPGMYSHFELNQGLTGEDHDTDLILEYDDTELYQNFRDFYEDIVPEFKAVGRVVQVKVSCNYEPHLRGNVYVQYRREEEAESAVMKFNGRYYGGKQLSCHYVSIPSWKSAVCGLFGSGRCPKGRNCNFLHVFKNPGNEFWEADRNFDRHMQSSHRSNFRERSSRRRKSRSRSLDRRGWSRSHDKWRSRSRSRDKRRSRSRSRDKRRSPSRSRDKQRSRSRSRDKRGSPSKSRDNRRSRSRSCDKRRSRSRSHDKGRSRSRSCDKRSQSRSRDRRKSRSRTRDRRKTRGRSPNLRKGSGRRSQSRDSRSASRERIYGHDRKKSCKGHSKSPTRSRDMSTSKRSRSRSLSRNQSKLKPDNDRNTNGTNDIDSNPPLESENMMELNNAENSENMTDLNNAENSERLCDGEIGLAVDSGVKTKSNEGNDSSDSEVSTHSHRHKEKKRKQKKHKRKKHQKVTLEWIEAPQTPQLDNSIT